MNPNVIKQLHLGILDLSLIGLGLATLLPFAGRFHWRIDLFSHFRVQYFFGLAALLLISLLVGNRRGTIAALVFALLNAALIAPLYLPLPNSSAETGRGYRFLFANVNTANRAFNSVHDLIVETDPDLILLLEIDPVWVDALSLSDLGYTHSELRPQRDNFGIGLFSRHPLETAEILLDPSGRTTGVQARVLLGGRYLELIGVHPPPPVTATASARRDEQIRAAFDLAVANDGTAILAGDFNATNWSQALAQPLAASGLRDSRAGFGPQATWPTFWPAALRIPIDHVFATEDVHIFGRTVGPEIGSDHLPLWLDFSLAGSED